MKSPTGQLYCDFCGRGEKDCARIVFAEDCREGSAICLDCMLTCVRSLSCDKSGQKSVPAILARRESPKQPQEPVDASGQQGGHVHPYGHGAGHTQSPADTRSNKGTMTQDLAKSAKRINAPILAVFWNAEGRLILALPFTQEGRICLQIAPELFAEFRFDPGYAVGNFADSAKVIAAACGFAGLTGVSTRAEYPVLCPVNAPVQRAAAEQTLPSALFSDFRTAPVRLVPAPAKPHSQRPCSAHGGYEYICTSPYPCHSLSSLGCGYALPKIFSGDTESISRV